MPAQELLNLIEALNSDIEATKQSYDAMMELRYLVAQEYDVLFKEQRQLKIDVQAEIAKLKEVRNQINEERAALKAQRDLVLIDKQYKEAVKPKKTVKFQSIYPITTLGGLGARR